MWLRRKRARADEAKVLMKKAASAYVASAGSSHFRSALHRARLCLCFSLPQCARQSPRPPGWCWPCRQGRACAGQSNSAQISVLLHPSRTTPASARAPKASCNASIRMDFPAPVSPVNTVKPLRKSSSSVCTITKSRRVICRNAMVRSPLHSSAASCAVSRSSSSPAGVENVHGVPIV